MLKKIKNRILRVWFEFTQYEFNKMEIINQGGKLVVIFSGRELTLPPNTGLEFIAKTPKSLDAQIKANSKDPHTKKQLKKAFKEKDKNVDN